MPHRYDLILKSGTVIDPRNQRHGVMDVAVAEGRIAEVGPDLDSRSAAECVDVAGSLVLPGIIDLHVHASSWLGGKFGHRMMALAGVTTALDLSGPMESVLEIARDHGAGLSLACLEAVRPGYTVKGADPDRPELEGMLRDSLQKGAYGLKILGGHYPLTPEATRRAIEAAHRQNAYLAFHAGTLNTKSNIEGFHEAIELIQDLPVHLAHINSYCRGAVRPCIGETEEAIQALEQHPMICSESYLSPINGTSAKCSSGVPESDVTKSCLDTGGFPATEAGLKDAIVAGWAQINLESDDQVVLAVGDEAVEWWRGRGTDTTVSFSVNPDSPRLRLASAKRETGDFVVDCISTDGGGIPRNVTVEMGLALVKLQAFTVTEFASKTSANPAMILGLENKGHLGVGADADISVLSLETQKPVLSVANGEIIVRNGRASGRSTRIITTPAGRASVEAHGLEPLVVDPADAPVCRRDSLTGQPPER
ncbi:MAG TPA: amidohydrolase family protein [Vicinamibacterales bacterium]|nr:amidohydrolase [Acidobacteriota bacterium]MDP7478034.1 amidohydrolase family protein [Vicinamibacterales bacterium]MDP7618641.1 amidohydrolase family protein [Dehalococcoidia bacterium]HJO38249.1 amidohydrolase family protein [Vicinamibacterales bacterium]